MSRRTEVWSRGSWLLPRLLRLSLMALAVLGGDGPRAGAQTAPSIVTQPLSRTNLAGTAATFTVVAAGDEPLLYQWFRDGTNAIPGATNAILLLPAVQLTDAGSYSASVTNAGGSILSDPARLVVVGLDFGDAPEPAYPTLLASDGARHPVFPGIRLGSAVTPEADASPDASAAGDNNPAGNEEDGVIFLTPLRAGQPAVVQVTASTSGVLSAWVDFNRAGGWAQAGEQIATNRPIAAGTNLIGFRVSNAMVPGQSFARFRFSSAGPLDVTGLAADGEVEDYAVPLSAAADLALGRSISAARVSPGDDGSYTITVTNLGPSSATGIFLTNVLSSRSSFVSVTSSQGSCANSAGIVTCSLGTLASGARATVTLTARMGAGTNLLVARVASNIFDPVDSNNLANAAILGSVTLPAYSNPDTIVLPLLDPGPGSIYPANIVVSGLTSAVLKATVTLRNINHDFPDDIDVLLVGPRGQKIYLMSDAGLDNALVDVSVTLDDDAAQVLPDSDPPIVTGTYRPSNYGTLPDNFASPAPPPPYVTNLSALINTDPNGVWSLYVMDDQPENGSPNSTEGFLADGWSLTLTTGDPLADLSITQTDQPDPIVVGNVLTYSLVVSNRGPSAATAQLHDVLPPGMSFLSATPSQGACAESGGVVDCSLGRLATAGSATVILRVTPTIGGSATNRANVIGSELDVNPTNSQAIAVTTVIPVADLALGLSASHNPLLLGQAEEFLLTVTNRGPNAASGILLTNLLPANLTFLEAAATQGACTNQAGSVVCTLSHLDAGATASFRLTAMPATTGVASNFASVTAAELDLVQTNNQAGRILEVLPGADLSVRVAAPGPSLPLGQTFTLFLAVTNRGPSTTTASLSDAFPASLVVVTSATTRGSCVAAGGSLACNLGSLEAGQEALVALTLRAPLLGSFTNTVTLNSDVGDPTLADRSATNSFNVVAAADLDLTLTDPPDTAWLGRNLIYRMTVTNRGPSTATAVVLTNRLPPGLNVLSFLPSQGNCGRQGSDVTCELGALAAGAGAVVTVTTRPDAVALLNASAQVSAELLDPNTANNQAARTTQVVDVSGSSTNAAPIDIPRVGIAAPYPSTLFVTGLTASVHSVRVTLTNLNHSFADDLDLLLVGPDGRGVVLMSDAGGEFPLINALLEFEDEAPEALPDSTAIASGSFRPTNFGPGDVFPAPAPPGPYGAQLSFFRGIDPNGPWSLYVVDDADKDFGQLTGGWSLALATLKPIANLVLGGRVSANPAGVSSNLVFTYTVTNRGPAVATGVHLTNFTPAALQLVSAASSGGSCVIAQGTVVCSLNDLAAGAGATVQLTATVRHAATETNFVSVQAAPQDLVPGDNVLATVLVFEEPPVLTLQPLSLMVTNGDNVVLAGAAAGSEPLTYQWQRNGVDLPGANTPLLAFPFVTPANAGTYRLRVSNRVGTALSQPASLTVFGPPTISDIGPITIDEDTYTQPLPFTVFDFESPPESIQVFAFSGDLSRVPASGLVLLGGGSNYTVQVFPLPNANGVAPILLIARDPDGFLSTNSFPLTIRPVNDPPTLSSIGAQQTAEDVPALVHFVASDPESAPEDLQYSASSSNPALVTPEGVSFSGTGNERVARVTPVLDQAGVATVTIHVTDPEGLSVSSQFVLTVTPENDPPTVDPISDLTLEEDSGSHVVALTGITSGAANETQHLTVSARSANPALIPHPQVDYVSPAASGSLTLTPQPEASGSVEITVTVRDGQANNFSFSRTFLVNIVPTNDPPILSGLADQTIDEDTPLALPFTVADPDSAPATLTVGATSSNPDLVADADLVVTGEDELRVLALKPAPNRSGQSTITVSATDTNGATTSRSFVLTVNSVNDAPTLDVIADLIIAEDAPLQVVNLTGLSTGAPDEAQPLTVRAVSSNPGIIPDPNVSYTSGDASGSLSFRPATNATGTALITVTVDDGQLTNNQVTRSFAVTVTGTNDSPVITGLGAVAMDEDTVGIVPFQLSDAETPALLLRLNATSSNQGLVANTNLSFEGEGTDRSLVIRPQTNQFGTLSISVTASDGAHVSTNTFALTINPVNDAPTLNPLTNVNLLTSPGLTTIPLSGISSGATNEAQALSVTVNNSNPALFLNTPSVSYPGTGSTGTLSFRTANNTIGSAVITVTVDDNGPVNDTISRSFVLNVHALANAQPTISAIPNQTVPEDTATAAIPFTVRDEETVASALVLGVASSNPTLLPTNNIVVGGTSTNRTITLTPASNQTGVATVTLTATDTAFGSTNLSFNLTVTPVNDPPTLSPIPDTVTLSGVPTRPIPFTVGDVETAPSALLVTAVSDNDVLLPSANIALGGSGSARGLLLTPVRGQVGSARITVRVTDSAATNSTSFQLTVNPTNHPPALSLIPDVQTSEDTPSAAVSFTIGDEETSADALSLTAVAADPGLIQETTLGGSGTNRTLVLVPAPNRFGSTRLTITLTDGGGAAVTRSLVCTVTPVNDAPTLDALADLLLNPGAPMQTVPLTGIGTGAANENQMLAVSASASDPNLIANLIVHYSSPASAGVLTFQPVPDAQGVATITVKVADGQPANGLASRVFTVTLNGRPQLSYIPDQKTLEDVPTPPISFTVSDPETPAELLTVEASSSNPDLIPGPLVVQGTGTNRFLVLSPVTNLSGSATITLIATDTNGAAATNQFVLDVDPVIDPIRISAQPSSFSGLVGTAALLQVTAASSLPLTYQWQRDGMDLPGATAPALPFPSVQLTDAGAYQVVIRNADTSVTSAPASLEVFVQAPSPRILALAQQGTTVTIQVSSVQGASYVLEASNDLISPLWSPVATLPGTGGPITFTDPNATSLARFYRVRRN